MISTQRIANCGISFISSSANDAPHPSTKPTREEGGSQA